MASIDDVADYVISEFPTPISTMKLQKLCYIAQGWTLAIVDEPLFDSDFEAWKNGPVNNHLFSQHRRRYTVGSWPSGDRTNIDPIRRAVLDGVLKNYGGLSGLQLGELTHQPSTPWSRTRARAGVTDGSWARTVIDKEDIKAHFKELLGLK